MAKLKGSFITDELDDGEFPLAEPPGPYLGQVVKSEVKVTSKGDGEYIALVWELLDEEVKGIRVFQNLNIVNPNPKTVSIAKAQLKQINKAAGIAELTDTNELHGIPMQLFVKITPANGPYKARNDITKVLAEDDAGSLFE